MNKQQAKKEMVSLWERASTDRWQLSNRAQSCENEGYHLPTITFLVSHSSHSLCYTASLFKPRPKNKSKVRIFHPLILHYWNSYLSATLFTKALVSSVHFSGLNYQQTRVREVCTLPIGHVVITPSSLNTFINALRFPFTHILNHLRHIKPTFTHHQTGTCHNAHINA